MRLRITAPDGGGFMSGNVARMFLDDVEVSKWISKVVLTVDADAPIQAEVTLFLTGVDCDVPVAIETLIKESGEAGVMGLYPRQWKEITA